MRKVHWHPAAAPPEQPPPDLGAPTHRSRLLLEKIINDPGDDEAWARLAGVYDEMAEGWKDWTSQQPWYNAPVADGLTHADAVDWLVELSCGNGEATPLLDAFTSLTLATDINPTMLADTPRLPRTRYLAADVRRLPFATGTVPMLVALNGVPHVSEFDRVLAPDGQLLWCTSFGAGTPLYVEPQRLADLFGDGWQGEARRIGHGDWLLLTRVSTQH